MTTQLSQLAVQRFVDNNGNALAGGQLYTYQAGTSTPAATYTDSTGVTPNTNPVILNARGEANVWVSPSQAYKFVLYDSLNNLIWSVDNISDGSLNSALGAALANTTDMTKGVTLVGGASRVVASIAALRTLPKTGSPEAFVTGYYAQGDGGGGAYWYDSTDTTSTDNGGTIIVASDGGRWHLSWQGSLNVKQFGAKGDGVSDDTSPINSALSAVPSGRVIVTPGTYLISAALVPSDNVEIVLAPGAFITTATANINIINAANKTNVLVYGPGKLQSTATGTTAYFGLINFDGATNCLAYGVEMQGNSWAGVFMRNATNCRAIRNYIHDGLGSVQDSAGVVVMDNCVSCAVEDNRIYNPGNHGILCQGSTAGTVPLQTHILDNDIDTTTAYGVACYQITTLNQFTLVQGNKVRNVSGSYTGGSKGAGIYIQNCGGVQVLGNEIRNVCTATSNNTLTPGGIGVNNINAGLVPPMVANNTIVDIGITSAGASNPNSIIVAGINISSSTYGANIGPNVFDQGVAATTMTPQYVGIYVNAASNVSIAPQNMQIANTLANSHGIFVYANGVSISNISIEGGLIIGCDYAAVRVDSTNSFTVSSFSITGTRIGGGSNNVHGLLLNEIVGGAATGVVCQTGTGIALSISASTQFRVAGGRYTTTGATAVATNNPCTDSVIDESVYIGGLPGSMSNAGTGIRAYVQLSAQPASGTWAVGDHWRTTTPAASTTSGGYCVGAGVPGTWKNEAALAA